MSVRLLFSYLKPQFWWLATIGLLFSFLNGCSTPSVETPKTPDASQIIIEKPPASSQPSSQETLEMDLRDALEANNWAKWLSLAETLWQQASPDQQLAIEYQIYQTLKNLPTDRLEALQQQAKLTQDRALLDWLSFIEVQQRPLVWRSTGYEDLANFHEQGIFLQHLIPQLKQHPQTAPLPQKVAVLLPFKGPYAKISQQIRNGILKYQFTHAPQLTLAFYNSADLNEVVKTTTQALEEGADFILGPLTKESIAELANKLSPSQSQRIWALNTVNNTPFKQMGFGSTSEALQIVQQLHYRGHQSIGLLASDAASDSKLAEQIQQAWLALDENHRVTLKRFAIKHPNHRKALGDAINESLSQARLNNLNWLLQDKLEFTPRPRQDLDALVVLSDAQTLAVFKPQMKFFELNLPIYASSKLTPTHFSDTPPLKDLQGVIFPTMRVALSENPSDNHVQTPFEAFGWDSLLALLNQANLTPGLCLNNGLTGQLTFDADSRQLDKQLVWVTYNAQGKLIRLPAPKPIYTIEPSADPTPAITTPTLKTSDLTTSRAVEVLPVSKAASF